MVSSNDHLNRLIVGTALTLLPSFQMESMALQIMVAEDEHLSDVGVGVTRIPEGTEVPASKPGRKRSKGGSKERESRHASMPKKENKESAGGKEPSAEARQLMERERKRWMYQSKGLKEREAMRDKAREERRAVVARHGIRRKAEFMEEVRRL